MSRICERLLPRLCKSKHDPVLPCLDPDDEGWLCNHGVASQGYGIKKIVAGTRPEPTLQDKGKVGTLEPQTASAKVVARTGAKLADRFSHNELVVLVDFSKAREHANFTCESEPVVLGTSEHVGFQLDDHEDSKVELVAVYSGPNLNELFGSQASQCSSNSQVRISKRLAKSNAEYRNDSLAAGGAHFGLCGREACTDDASLAASCRRKASHGAALPRSESPKLDHISGKAEGSHVATRLLPRRGQRPFSTTPVNHPNRFAIFRSSN